MHVSRQGGLDPLRGGEQQFLATERAGELRARWDTRARGPYRLGRARHPAAENRDLFLNDRSCIVVAMPRPREFEPDQVLDSAMRQFWERGYRATSVDDLVRATGVKPGSLYSAFPGGKHALLMEIGRASCRERV